jgi:hypothetical protein
MGNERSNNAVKTIIGTIIVFLLLCNIAFGGYETSDLCQCDGGFYSDGTTGSTPTSGAGTRLMWIPDKHAFRAGMVQSTQWDADNIGLYSFAGGWNTIASGAMSTSLCANNEASGADSFCANYQNTSSGDVSACFGYNNVASGYRSFCAGENNQAQSCLTAVFGRYNVGGGAATDWVATDPLYEIGIGADVAHRANALTVLKNGNFNFHTGDLVSNSVVLVDGDGVVNKAAVEDSGNWDTAFGWGDHSAGGYQAQGDVLDDLNTLGVNAADSEFLVGTGAGALAWENAATARTSLGLGNGDSPTFVGLTLSGAIATPTDITASGNITGFKLSLGGSSSAYSGDILSDGRTDRNSYYRWGGYNGDLTMRGVTPSIKQQCRRATGGLAFNMFELSAYDTTSDVEADFGKIGVYGDFNADPAAPTCKYLFLDARTTAAYSNAHLKIGLNGIGIGIPSNTVPARMLDVRGESTFSDKVRIGDTTAPTEELEVNGQFALQGKSELTIDANAIIPTKSFHTVDTQGDIASDELTTITFTDDTDGTTLIIRPVNDARTVVVKNGTGNIVCGKTGGDVTLDDETDTFMCVYDADLNKWLEL